MTQSELNRAVAQATGETVQTIASLGFSIVDPDEVDFDLGSYDIEAKIIDWDELAARRATSVFAAP